MYVIEVIPIGRGMHAESLSYFSSEPYERGVLLTIPIRSKNTVGIVLKTVEASGVKTALRAATFSLRRLPFQRPLHHLSESFLKTAEKVAAYHAATIGATIFGLLPKEIINGVIPIPQYKQSRADIATLKENNVFVLQAEQHERFSEYAKLIRGAFANKESVLFVAPTLEQCRQAYDKFSGGIEERTVLLHSHIGMKQLRTVYQIMEEEVRPILIVSTPQRAFIGRPDIDLVIIENERSHGYRGKSRPYIDYRHALTIHAVLNGRRIIIGDLLIRTEEEYELKNNNALPYGNKPKRIQLPGKLAVINMKPDPDGTRAFKLFSNKLIAGMKEVIEKKERIFLFAARRGLAPIVACVDCGHILRDPESDAPFSLHKRMRNGVEERWFVCSVSGFRQRAYDLCPVCGSWRLRERGIGIQYVHEELTTLIDKKRIILFDHTTASTPKKASELQKQFYKQKGSVLLGTALALPYLIKPVSLSAIVSVDSLKAIPSWRQEEESLNVLLIMRERTHGTVMVQTRSDDTSLFDYATHGSVETFYENELSSRETYNYPPYSVFIHISWQGAPDSVKKTEEMIEREFEPYNITVYGGVPQQTEGMIRYGLIRVPKAKWPHYEIIEKLRALAPSIRVMINPDRIV